jgi:hypothetical protein
MNINTNPEYHYQPNQVLPINNNQVLIPHYNPNQPIVIQQQNPMNDDIYPPPPPTFM